MGGSATAEAQIRGRVIRALFVFAEIIRAATLKKGTTFFFFFFQDKRRALRKRRNLSIPLFILRFESAF